jgi:hypothetical protein
MYHYVHFVTQPMDIKVCIFCGFRLFLISSNASNGMTFQATNCINQYFLGGATVWKTWHSELDKLNVSIETRLRSSVRDGGNNGIFFSSPPLPTALRPTGLLSDGRRRLLHGGTTAGA